MRYYVTKYAFSEGVYILEGPEPGKDGFVTLDVVPLKVGLDCVPIDYPKRALMAIEKLRRKKLNSLKFQRDRIANCVVRLPKEVACNET